MLPFAHPHALLDLLLARAESTEPTAASSLSPAEERGEVGAASATSRRKELSPQTGGAR